MPYELFQNKAAKFGSPQLTITGGRIAFNANAGDILDKVSARFAHLLWDAEACRLAIRPVKKQDGNAFLISTLLGKRGKTISARSFLNYIQWFAASRVTVDVGWNEGGGQLEADLPKAHISKGPAPPMPQKKRKHKVI